MKRTTRVGTILAFTLAVALGFISLFAQKIPAQGAGLVALTSNGIKAAVEELVPQIEKAAGRPLAPQFNSSKALRDKIMSGEKFDVAILSTDLIDDLIRNGKIADDSRTEIATTGMGVGVRAGAPKPDITTSEAFKKTLENSKSISFNPIGASAVHIHEMFASMGIAESVKSKLLPDARPGGPQLNVAEGKAELVLTLGPEIQFFPGVELVGPVPAEYQSYIGFAAGIAKDSRNVEGAKALIKFLIGPHAAATMKSKGMEPR